MWGSGIGPQTEKRLARGAAAWRGPGGRRRVGPHGGRDVVELAGQRRAPAKTQAALLEVMQERQITIEGKAKDYVQAVSPRNLKLTKGYLLLKAPWQKPDICIRQGVLGGRSALHRAFLTPSYAPAHSSHPPIRAQTNRHPTSAHYLCILLEKSCGCLHLVPPWLFCRSK